MKQHGLLKWVFGLCLLLTLCLLVACGPSETPAPIESDTSASTQTEATPGSAAESVGESETESVSEPAVVTESATERESETVTETETVIETETVTEIESITETETATETETETETEPQISSNVVMFEDEEILSFIQTTGCKAELFRDDEKGTVLKVQATAPVNYLHLDYESYLTAKGRETARLEDERFAVIMLKTGAGYGDAHKSSSFAFDYAAGADEECKVSDAYTASYDANYEGWQTIVIDLSSGKTEGTLHSLLLTATYKTRADDYYCIASVSFARSMLDILKMVEEEDVLKGLTSQLTESIIDGVNTEKRTAPDEDASVAFWFDHITERRAQHDTTASDMASYLMRMPGNSIEGCQFFLAPEADRTFSLSLTDFANDAGNTLRTELFYERYYLVEDIMLPDALPPLVGDIAVTGGNSQGFYIKVWADADEPAGLYTAELEVKDAATGKVIKVATVYTYVWDFSLSDETAMKTAVGLGSGHIYNTYTARDMTEQSKKELYKAYYDFLLENRICAYSLPYSLSDDGVWDYLNNPRVNTFRITGDAAEAYGILSPYPDIQKKGYFYIVDEPTNMSLLNSLKNHATQLETAYPGYRMISPFFTNIDTGNGVDQIEFMQSCLSIWNTKVFAFTPRKYSFISGAQYLTTEEVDAKYGTFSERMAAEVAGGDDLWVYFCWEPAQPYANWLLTGDGTEPIVSVWQCRNTDCTGILYWGTTYWTENLKSAPAGVDVWGDGVLLHSGAEYGIYEPVSSLRLENVRNGIQDYQMLHMVEELAGRAAADELTALVSVNVVVYTSDDDHLHAARVLLGEKVESLLH